MMRSVTTRYALRSLRRNLKRTLLSAFGVAFGVGIGLIATSFVGGQMSMLYDAAARGGVGHLEVTADTWAQSRRLELRLDDWQAQLEAVRGVEGVRLAAPHASARALLGFGTRSVQVTLSGVDPEVEQDALRYVREMDEGEYLASESDLGDGQIVLGRSLVTRLDAEVGDELVVTSVDGDGEITSALVVLVGVADVHNRQINDSISQVPLGLLETLSGRVGPTSIAILLDSYRDIEPVRPRVERVLRGDNELVDMFEVSSELRAGQAKADGYTKVMLFVILLVVLMGVMSAQLTSVLERRKEFAVLAALGMRGSNLVFVLITEGLALGVLSAGLAIGWAAPIVANWAANGVDLRGLYSTQDEGIAQGSILMEMVFYPEFGVKFFVTALALALGATLVASIYPALFASRTDPAAALRVDR